MPQLLRLPRSFAHPDVLRHGAIVFAASSTVNVVNYVYHIAVGRLVGPAEYAVFASLLAAVSALLFPSGVIQAVFARYAAQLHAMGQGASLLLLARRGVAAVALAGLIVLVATVVASESIAEWLRVSSRLPIVVMGAVVCLGLVQPVAQGLVQGLERFGYFGAGLVAGGLFRFASGLGLVVLGLGATGALAGSLMGSLAFMAIAFVALRHIKKGGAGAAALDLKVLATYSTGTLLAFLAFAVLTNIDVVVAKGFFPPVEAGYYAAAAILGKVLLYLPGAVAIVLFPKSSRRHALGQDGLGMLRKSALVVAGLSAPVLAVYGLFPGLVAGLAFGQEYLAAAALVPIQGLAMAVYALVYILMTHHLATHNLRFVGVAAAAAALGALLIGLFHSSPMELALVTLANALVLLALSETFCRTLFRFGGAPTPRRAGA